MKKYFSFILITLLMSNIYLYLPANAEMTQLEAREYQTRTYETNDIKMVMKAVINALQDDQYIINNANTDLGLITASKESDIKEKKYIYSAAMTGAMAGAMMGAMFGCAGLFRSSNIPITDNKTKIESTANITSVGNLCKIRVNFTPLMKEKFYQDFFAKVDKSIFIQKERI